MDTIYRVRPANNHTLDELNNSYLWFSRPIGFKGDINDANIAAFINDTEAIKRGIDHSLPNFPYERFCKQMEHTGICCFTTECPDDKIIKKFPKCSNGNSICIEYDRHKLEEFFLNHRTAPIYPCFIPVIYDDNPTKLQTNGEWSILWNKDENGEIYKTIPGDIYIQTSTQQILHGSINIPYRNKSITFNFSTAWLIDLMGCNTKVIYFN